MTTYPEWLNHSLQVEELGLPVLHLLPQGGGVLLLFLQPGVLGVVVLLQAFLFIFLSYCYCLLHFIYLFFINFLVFLLLV